MHCIIIIQSYILHRRHSVSPLPFSKPITPLKDKSASAFVKPPPPGTASISTVPPPATVARASITPTQPHTPGAHPLGGVNDPVGPLTSHTAFEIAAAAEDEEKPSETEPASIYLKTASYLLDVHALKFAGMSLAHELTREKGSHECPAYLVAEARLHMEQHMYLEAKKCLKRALMADVQNSNAWALLGHAHYYMGEYEEAQDAYERTLGFLTPPVHTHVVYTRLANIYLRQEKVCDIY